jgi:hypothetical protein
MDVDRRGPGTHPRAGRFAVAAAEELVKHAVHVVLERLKIAQRSPSH